jgi:hypothetical protein
MAEQMESKEKPDAKKIKSDVSTSASGRSFVGD